MSNAAFPFHFQMTLLFQLQLVMWLLQKRRFLNSPPRCLSWVLSTCDPRTPALWFRLMQLMGGE